MTKDGGHGQVSFARTSSTLVTIMETAILSCCSNPGCGQPGTNQCSACKTTPYCGPTCQSADWPHHKEECEGHLLKIGSAHLAKAKGFFDARSYVQALR